MCIIVEKFNAVVTPEWHNEFWAKNSDGFGAVEFLEGAPMGERIRVTKTMSKVEAWDIVDRLNNDAESNAILHYRMATHGSTGLAMCHPFVIECDGGPVAVTHNGMLSDYPTPDEFDPSKQSDTYAFVYHFLAPMLQLLPQDKLRDFLRSPSFHWQIENILGSSNRLVITDQFGHVTYNNGIWHTKVGGVLAGLRLSNTYAWSDIDAPRVKSVWTNSKWGTPKNTGTTMNMTDAEWDDYLDRYSPAPSTLSYTKSSAPIVSGNTAQAVGTSLEEEAEYLIGYLSGMTFDQVYDTLVDDPELAAQALFLLTR